ncbi:rhomboid family intramembrane serine protease [Sphingomonas sinipercae]|uniref:Rhomboid family intramembrane serine protease n=2 Tax=Sphingomonas sinipercae TaxID=2714944 RepID=A0A6G7ZQS3_9SPHN|nr:rhomboid family intramembrane serine protease [Sphingomonas sinipercae]
MGFIPIRWSGADLPFAAVPAILTPLSATLVHGGLLHLALNLLILLWCGTLVERVLGIGSMILLYLVAAYTSALAQWAVDPSAVTPMIGASGAIAGIIGAFALSFGRPRRFVKSNFVNQLINAVWLLAAWIVLQLMTGFLGGTQGLMIATPAHVGGFVAGLLLQRPLLLWRYRGA